MIENIVAYTATSSSILGRLVFMHLLYTKKSTNPYSLLFCIMNICSSLLWIIYGQMVLDIPIIVRSSSDLLLFIISSFYIEYNRIQLYKNELEIETKSETSKIII